MRYYQEMRKLNFAIIGRQEHGRRLWGCHSITKFPRCHWNYFGVCVFYTGYIWKNSETGGIHCVKLFSYPEVLVVMKLEGSPLSMSTYFKKFETTKDMNNGWFFNFWKLSLLHHELRKGLCFSINYKLMGLVSYVVTCKVQNFVKSRMILYIFVISRKNMKIPFFPIICW